MNIINNLALKNENDVLDISDIPAIYRNDRILLEDILEYSNVLQEYRKAHRNFTHFIREINFSNIKNENIKNEIKVCFYKLTLTKNKYSSFKVDYSYLRNHIIEFLNETSTSYKSILDDSVKYDYIEFLKNKNIEISHKRKSGNISKDMCQNLYDFSCHEIITFNTCCIHLKEYLERNMKEFDKDIWNVDKLGIKIINNEGNKINTLNFTYIQQPKMKNLSKEYILFKLKTRPIKSSLNELRELNIFTIWLYKKYKNISSFEELNRKIIEEYISYLRNESTYSKDAVSRNLGFLKNFFATCVLCGFKNVPKQTLITNSDYYGKKSSPMIKFYNDDEIKLINENIGKLPLMYGQMLFIVENIGMRNSELRTLKTTCLIENNNNYYLEYFQIKTKQLNKIPINEMVAKVLNATINNSKKKFGENVEYIFTEDGINPISSYKLSTVLNKWIIDNNIRKQNGDLLRINIQYFRGTVATKYINLGLDINIIIKMLGHSSSQAIYHYIEIHNDTLLNAVKPIIDMQESLISNIGNIKEVNIERIENNIEFIKLSNGSCCKPISEGICKHANACLTCKMFKYDKSYLPLYENQLNEVNANIEIAKANGFERILENNLELKTSLEKIIESIKGVNKDE